MGEKLYTNRAASIRELIQNSIDACLVRKTIDSIQYNPKINVSIDIDPASNKWIKITDNGIGMDEYVISEYFLKIGSSYYNSTDFTSFYNRIVGKEYNSISKFGIGFLSVFMICDALEVVTKNKFSPRKDYKTRKIFIENKKAIAFVKEEDNEDFEGTTIRLLLKDQFAKDESIQNFLSFLKTSIIRPEIPININLTSKATDLTDKNYITLKDIKVNKKNYNLETVVIDVERFSEFLKGRIIIFLIKNADPSLSLIQNEGKPLTQLQTNDLLSLFP